METENYLNFSKFKGHNSAENYLTGTKFELDLHILMIHLHFEFSLKMSRYER